MKSINMKRRCLLEKYVLNNNKIYKQGKAYSNQIFGDELVSISPQRIIL